MFIEDNAPAGDESLEESIAGAVAEVEQSAGEPVVEAPKQGEVKDEGAAKEDPEPKSELSKAAATLAASKKGRAKKQVVEKEQLDIPEKPVKPLVNGAASIVPVDEEVEETFSPPQRWDVKAKEDFHQLPKLAQRQILDYWGGIERNTQHLWQDLNREKGRYTEANEVLDHYLPRWNLNNITPGQAIRELCAANDLINANPIHGISLLMQKTGVTLDHLSDFSQGRGGAPAQHQNGYTNSVQPQESRLTLEDIRREVVESLKAQQNQTAMRGDVEALEGFRNEVSEGKYVYPELWDSGNQAGNYWNADYIERVKPLVVAARKAQPGMSITDATKRAIATLRHFDGPQNGSPSSSPQRLPNQNEIQRAKAASVSVRGRGNAIAPILTEAEGSEKIEDSLRAVMAGTTTY